MLGRASLMAPRSSSTALVRELAQEVGFDLVGFAPLRRPRGAERFEAWLKAGLHAGMSWLERDRQRIVDPESSLPGGRSLIVLGMGHARPAVTTPEGARVARYAAGRDYHNWIRKKQRRLARRLRGAGLVGEWRATVDAGPLLERSHAAEAGLGFESRSANLLHPVHGPWFFLGALLVDTELEPTSAPAAGSCGTCTACLDACPTAAILEPGLVDAGRCLSYQTIENRGPVPHELRESLDGWAFGCDVCSEVCPWGHGAPDSQARLGTHPAVEGGLAAWLSTPPEAWADVFRGSPLQRAERDGLARNAALGLGHRPSDTGLALLRRALEVDPSPIVREAAHWALTHAHLEDAGVRHQLDLARQREPDRSSRERMVRNLEGTRVAGVLRRIDAPVENRQQGPQEPI